MKGMFLIRMGLPTGSSLAEEVRHDALPEDADLRGSLVVLLREELAGLDVPRAHERPVHLRPLDGRGPVLVSVDDLSDRPDRGGDVGDRRDLPADRVDVVLGELRARAESGTGPRRRDAAGDHHEEVRPEGLELVLRLDARPFADPDDGHDARDADDDPEGRQEGAHLVAREGPERDPEDVRGLLREHGSSLLAGWLPVRRRLRGPGLPRRQAQPASDSSRIFRASSTSDAETIIGGAMRMTFP